MATGTRATGGDQQPPAMSEEEDGTFYLQQVTITEESEGDYQYEEVPADDDISILEGDESLENIVKTIEQQNEDLKAVAQEVDLFPARPVSQRPEVVDDFLRNFLIAMGMMKTLDCFQTEWVSGLQAALRAIECGCDFPVAMTSGYKGHSECRKDGPRQRALAEARAIAETKEERHHCDPPPDSTKRDSEFPIDTRVNPYLAQMKGSPSNLLRSGGCKMTKTLKVHELAVSCLALHPRKQILVTGSDERLWKMWSIPDGDIIMTGEGHGDWLSGCCFHPSGNMLATTSGDKTVKIWDFAKVECVFTFTGHLHVVWGCSWHTCGDFIASCSMDNAVKIWDINSQRCRQTLRGHVDSVNSVQFLPFSNTLLTSAADKTLSLWDARTGLCAQTFFGHLHSCNDATFNLKGDTIVSCDSYGILKLWDVRKVSLMLSVDAGPHPGNQVIFHPSAHLVVMASNDGTVKILDLPSGQLHSLAGHEDAVQCVRFDHKGEYVVSGGSDGTVRLWT
ncbi:sperm-associated antigen 16 protein-like [Scyliorhinus canicula]|uniref:sperm-associated antigen 16 protein-like n=1 Tax=Scyliorhinus canicula TaxID=7830 RepID=UPI0018F7412C|nr:sperm-associated antigen 16 protein-like [Scyliorhinus canicula]